MAHFQAPYKAAGSCREEGLDIRKVSEWFSFVLCAYLPMLKCAQLFGLRDAEPDC